MSTIENKSIFQFVILMSVVVLAYADCENLNSLMTSEDMSFSEEMSFKFDDFKCTVTVQLRNFCNRRLRPGCLKNVKRMPAKTSTDTT